MGWTWYTECGSETVLGQGWWTWYRASKWTWSTAGDSIEKDGSRQGRAEQSREEGRHAGQRGCAQILVIQPQQPPGVEADGSAHLQGGALASRRAAGQVGHDGGKEDRGQQGQ